MNSNAFSFNGVNRRSKGASIIFMLLTAVLSNIPAILSWLTDNTHLSAGVITMIGMVLGYLAKTYIMPTLPSTDPTPTV